MTLNLELIDPAAILEHLTLNPTGRAHGAQRHAKPNSDAVPGLTYVQAIKAHRPDVF
jgi:hypothetical protein